MPDTSGSVRVTNSIPILGILSGCLCRVGLETRAQGPTWYLSFPASTPSKPNGIPSTRSSPAPPAPCSSPPSASTAAQPCSIPPPPALPQCSSARAVVPASLVLASLLPTFLFNLPLTPLCSLGASSAPLSLFLCSLWGLSCASLSLPGALYVSLFCPPLKSLVVSRNTRTRSDLGSLRED